MQPKVLVSKLSFASLFGSRNVHQFNRVFITGIVNNDVSMTISSSKVPVSTFKLANTTLSGKTEIVPIVAFYSLAKYCAINVKKGNTLTVEGHLGTNAWTNKTGKKISMLVVIAENFRLESNSEFTPSPVDEASFGPIDEDIDAAAAGGL